MFYGAAILVLSAMQSVIVWRVFQNGKRTAEAINLLGEIKMKQEDFDKQVAHLSSKVADIDTNLDTESGEIKSNLSALRDEIVRLKESQGDNIDTSKLDEISNRLEDSATRISGLVDPLPVNDGQTPPIAEPAQTVDATATATVTETPATSVEAETTVTTKTEDAAGDNAEASATAETSTGEAAVEAEADASDNKDAE